MKIGSKYLKKGDFQVKMAKKVILAEMSKKSENLGYRWFTFSPSLYLSYTVYKLVYVAKEAF